MRMRFAGTALSIASGGCLAMAFAAGGQESAAIAADPLAIEPAAVMLDTPAAIAEPDLGSIAEQRSRAEEFPDAT